MSDELVWEQVRGEPDQPLQQQLVVFARELGQMYQAERRSSAALDAALANLQETYSATIRTLTSVVEAKDKTSRAHVARTHDLALALTQRVDPDLATRPEVGFGFLLHDIGKVGVPESILWKDGPLDEDEWRIMRSHPVLGVDLVEPMSFLGEAIDIIRWHHERWDGTGYPEGLAGQEIPLAARILGLADAFVAMTSERPYRPSLSLEHAMDEIARGRGAQFDPAVVEVFLLVLSEGHVPLEGSFGAA